MNQQLGNTLANSFGQFGGQAASKRKPIALGMTVLDVSTRPYREVVINKIASRYDDESEPEYALIGYDTWRGKRTEWIRTWDLIPIEKEGESE